jgi:hypothetical protein
VNNPTQPEPTAQNPNLDQTNAAAAEAKSAIDQYNKDRAISTAPPVVKHQTLLRMISGLATGLGAFGTAIATHGREGGVEEVTRVQGEQQRQELEAQAARDKRKNQVLQQDLTNASNQIELANMYKNLASLPDETATKHLQVQEARLGVIGQTQDIRTKAMQDLIATGDVDSYNKTLQQIGGVSSPAPGAAPTGVSAGAPTSTPAGAPTNAAASTGTAAVGPTANIPPMALASWQNTVDAAVEAYPKDVNIQQAAKILADPNSTPVQKATAARGAQNRMQALDVGVSSRTKQQAADPLYKLETDPSEMTGDKAPAAIALLSSKLNDPDLSPDQKPRVQRLLSMARQAQKNDLAFEAAKERTKQAITDGDPKAAGALLQSGLVSPQELISSRKPQFAQAAFDEAIRLGGGVKGADGKWTGGTWSAVAAESQYEYAKNPKTQNTLNLLTTMQAPGGSIDIAQKTFNTIPGKIDEKTFNKIVTGGITEFGGQSTVAFQAAMVSLTDEYAQVLQGGAATETTLKQAKELIQQAYTKTQGSAAFDTIRLDMAARQKGMVRDNPALMKMYPNTAAPVQSVGHKPGDTIVQNGHNYVVTAVDANGKVTGANPQ